MDNLNKALEFLFIAEGGYSNRVNDAGGATNFGITQTTFDRAINQGTIITKITDVKYITKDLATQIYKHDYWDAIKADTLPVGIDIALFDMTVNAGQKNSIKTLQKTLGIKDDGIIGTDTLNAVKSYKGDLLKDFNNNRREYNEKVIENNQEARENDIETKGYTERVDQSKNKNGWENRINNLEKFIKDKVENEKVENENNQNNLDDLPPTSVGNENNDNPITTPSSDVNIPNTNGTLTNTYEGGYGTITEKNYPDGSTSYDVPNQYGGIDVVTIDKDGNLIRNDIESNNDLTLLLKADEQSQNLIDISKLEKYANSGQIQSDVPYDYELGDSDVENNSDLEFHIGVTAEGSQYDNNSQEVLNQTYSSKDFAKDAISLQSASVDEIVEYASKNFDLDTNQIDSFRGTIGAIKSNAVGGIFAWDSSKSTGENIAYVTGTLVQGYGEGLLVGGLAIAGFPEFVLGLSVSYIANQAGVDLGQEFENIYNYAQDFQATNTIELQRFEELKTSNPEAYQNMVQSGIYPENTTQWNAHVNELTTDLYNRKAENLQSTINYDKSATIDDNTTLADIALANGLTEEQILDYNNLNIKPDDYGNIKDGTVLAVPNKPEVSDGVTIYTDSEGNQKIISVDKVTGKETVFYYDAKDYSLLEIDGNIQVYNRVNSDGSVTTQKLGLGSIEVTDSNNKADNITVRNISDVSHELVYDSSSKISAHTQLDVLLRQNTNNNLPIEDLAIANGYANETELREAFESGKKVITPTKQLISTDENGNKISEYNMDNGSVVKSTVDKNGNVVNENHTSNTIETPTFNTTQPTIENNNYTINDKVIPLQANQTISHIAQNTPYNSIELLEYNNLTLEQAKHLPVGFEVQIPKDITEIQTPQGNIKLFENYDGSETAILPEGITGEKTTINFDEDTSTLLYGDRTNPDKITYVDDVTNNYVEISKDSNGSYYKSLESNDNFIISYDNKNTATDIQITFDNVSLDDIANLTSYSKEDLQAFNFLDGNTVDSNTNFQLPASKEPDIQGGYGDITHFTTKYGHDIFVVPQEDGSSTSYGTFTNRFYGIREVS